MTAALAAQSHGLDTVLIEKSAYFGGSTARSGGGVWIPGNYALKAAGQARRPGAVQALPRLDRRRRRPEGPPRHLPRPRPRGPGLRARARRRCGSPGCRSTPTTTPRRPAAGPRAAPCEPIPMDARFLGDELDAAAPAVHQGAGEPDRHPGRLPQDQPRPAHHPRPAHDGQGAAPADRQPGAAAQKMYAMGNAIAIGLRKGLVDAERAGPLRHRAHRPGDRGRPGRRRARRAGRPARSWSAPAAA